MHVNVSRHVKCTQTIRYCIVCVYRPKTALKNFFPCQERSLCTLYPLVPMGMIIHHPNQMQSLAQRGLNHRGPTLMICTYQAEPTEDYLIMYQSTQRKTIDTTCTVYTPIHSLRVYIHVYKLSHHTLTPSLTHTPSLPPSFHTHTHTQAQTHPPTHNHTHTHSHQTLPDGDITHMFLLGCPGSFFLRPLRDPPFDGSLP